MKRLALVAVGLGVVASLAGCATPCCYCYCGELPTRDLAVDEARREIAPEIAPSLKPIVVARY